MENLIIGSTSQLSHFFPEDYKRISSRNVNMIYLKNNQWNSVYITFAEQHTSDPDVDCLTPNFEYTVEIIKNLELNTKKIIIYTTCELWNEYIGEVSLEEPVKYTWPNNNGYCLSKELLWKTVNIHRGYDKWKNVIIIHPFNFNSSYRTKDFLFGKIYDSIINKKKITIGDTYFYRDMVHAKYIVERSMRAKKDEMVSAGRLHFVNDYIRDLYKSFGMQYEDWVTEKLDNKARHSQKLFYSKQNKIYT